jgi:D-alanine-D-alanine ligase
LALKVALVYNDPVPDRYNQMGEEDAIAGVLSEVKAVYDGLLEMGHSVVKVPLSPPVESIIPILAALDADVFFNLFEGFAGRPETEAMVAGIMSVLGKPFTGSPPPSLALALDKAKTKQLLIAAGLNTPKYQLLNMENLGQLALKYPCIVKPAAEDASHGVNQESVVHDEHHLRIQVEKICSNYGGNALVEEFIDGREFAATIIGNRRPVITAISEIIFALPEGLPRMLTFGAKWLSEDVYYHFTDPKCPADIDDELKSRISDVALAVYRMVGCRGYARVDMRLDDAGRVNVLEINPNPDITPTVVWDARLASIGLNYPQFFDRIVQLAFDRE